MVIPNLFLLPDFRRRSIKMIKITVGNQPPTQFALTRHVERVQASAVVAAKQLGYDSLKELQN